MDRKMIYGSLLGFYILLLLVLTVFQRSFIYFPDNRPPALSHYGQATQGYEVVTTKTEDGLKIEGWYHPPEDPEKPVLLWFHGNGGVYAQRIYAAKRYSDQGYGVLLASYRGYGGNSGQPTEQNLYKDAEAWIRTLTDELKISMERLVLYGESLGSGVAVEMATRYNAYALILHTPYKSIRAIAQKTYPIVPVGLLLKDQYDSLSRIQNIKMPVFMMHGTTDEVIPYAHAWELYEAAPEPKEFKAFKGAAHYNIYDFGAHEAVIDFLNSIKNNAAQ